MCGIFGYIGKRDPLQICLSGLSFLEYRGYDSTGVCGIVNQSIAVRKKEGKLSELQKILSDLPKFDLAIAHTRWATHGKVNDQNAHPHLDAAKSIALVHNGIIENYADLKAALLQEGTFFTSDTDTEVIAHLIAKHYRGDLLHALHQTIPLLKGTFALLVIHKDHPLEMVAAARECPLSIISSDLSDEAMVSSDPNALSGMSGKIFFLQEGESARVKKAKVDIFDAYFQPLQREGKRLEIEDKIPSKEGFKHFMLKEIFEQPLTVAKAFRPFSQGDLPFPAEFFRKIKNVWILGCGTSAHAGQIGAMFLEDLARLPASTEIASEARYRNLILTPDTLIIAISQSGETADTLAAMRETKKYGCKTIAICNGKNSTLTREADATLFLNAGPEMSVCSTKAFTSQLAVLLRLTLHLAQIRGEMDEKTVVPLVESMEQIPSMIQRILDRVDVMQKLAKKYSHFDNFFFMGRRYMYPTCLESALKLKEISYVNANGYPSGELKHGPIALLDPHFPVIAFCSNAKTQDKTESNLAEVKARGAPILAFASEDFKEVENIANDVFFLPKTIDPLSPFLSAVAGQLFAYFFAETRGLDIDQPRNLAKSVTVE